MRKIIHVDMDAFYASVEQRDFPELKGKPVAVGGSSQRGVVASASYEARAYGVRSAMPSVVAKRKCPELIFVKSRFDVYREVSQQIREIFLEYTDLVEPLSLDEAYLDVTENKKQIWSAIKIAQEIRAKINEQTDLTASAGVSFNKFLAKIASDINKPNGLKVILPEEAELFLEELPIGEFHGIGKVTAERMKRMGILNGKNLKEMGKLELLQRFGKVGAFYYRIVRAQDERPVNPHRIRKSIGAERTFSEDVHQLAEMRARLQPIIATVFKYMQNNDNFGRTVTLKLKDPEFKIHTRSRTFAGEIRSQQKMESIVYQLLAQHWEEGAPVRLLGVSVSNLRKDQGAEGLQLELDFADE